MKIKTYNILCLSAVILHIIGAVYTLILMCLGKISDCLSAASGLGEAVGSACVGIILILFIVLAMVAQGACVLAGVATLFSGKRKLSVTVGTTFVTIFNAAALALYFFSFLLTLSACTTSGGNGAWMFSAYAFNAAVCIYTACLFIVSGIKKNKTIADKKKNEAQFEAVSGGSEPGKTVDNSDAEEATYTEHKNGK